MASGIVVLTSPDVQAAKGNGPLRLGFHLRHQEYPLQSFDDLHRVLIALLPHTTAYAIRGGVADTAPALIRRRLRHDPWHVRDVARQWVCVDIDARPVPFDCFADPLRAVQHIRSRLPIGLRKAQCYYALTRSCQPHLFHGHLWFWLDRCYTSGECHRALTGLCDESLFRPTQPHFTAAPIVTDDPLEGRRRGILPGEPLAWLGEEPERKDPEAAEAELEKAQADIAARTKGNRHRAINRAAYYLGRWVANDSLDRGRCIQALVAAAQVAGLDDERAESEVCRGLADGIRDAPERESWQDRLQRSESGVPRSTYLNAAIALSESSDWAGVLGWNTRYSRVDWIENPPVAGFATARQGEPFRDEHALLIVEWLGSRGMAVPRGTALDVASDVAHKTEYDPVTDILDDLDWDGVSRIDTWLTDYLGVADDKKEWASLVGRRWLIAAVARAYGPGCKADNILVLEGPQGRYKSTALDVLGLGYTREVRVKLDDTDASDALHSGTWIAVLTELDAFKRTARIESIKAFVSALEDHYRKKYGRHTATHARSMVFAATTNDDSYLNDPTGNRRFWPVRCGEIDIAALRRDVQLLWAEARAAYLSGSDQWWLEQEHSAIAHTEQTERMLPDPWEEYVATYLHDKDFVTVNEVLERGLQFLPSQQNASATARVVRLLLKAGFGQGIATIGGKRKKGYKRL